MQQDFFAAGASSISIRVLLLMSEPHLHEQRPGM